MPQPISPAERGLWQAATSERSGGATEPASRPSRRKCPHIGTSLGTLEQAHGDQPDANDFGRQRAADLLAIVAIDVALLIDFSHAFRDAFGVNPAPVFRKIERFDRLV